MSTFNILFVESLPGGSLLPNSFYLVNGDKPKFYVTSKLKEAKLINPDIDLSELVKTVNKLSSSEDGNVSIGLELDPKSGNINVSGNTEGYINLDDRYINKKDLTDELKSLLNRLGVSSNSETSSSGLTIPIDHTLTDRLPSEEAGTVLRIINNKQIDGISYNIGDLLVYYNSSESPVHIKTTTSGLYLGVFNDRSDFPRVAGLNSVVTLLNDGDYYFNGTTWIQKSVKSYGTFLGVKDELPTKAGLYDLVMVNDIMYYYNNSEWTELLNINNKANIDASNLEDHLEDWYNFLGLEDQVTGDDF